MLKKIVSVFCVILLTGVSVFAVKGSGNLSIEERPVSDFHTVYFNCPGKLNITQGNKTLVKVKADDNVISNIKTEIKRGELIISLKGIVSDANIEIDIIMQNINKVEINGSGVVSFNGAVQADNIELRVNGGGGVNIQTTSNFVFTKIYGNGYVDITGSVNTFESELAGGAEIRALNLNAKVIKLKFSGLGKTSINVSDNLEIKVGGFGGNGTVEYKGKPKIKIDVFGSANIISLD